MKIICTGAAEADNWRIRDKHTHRFVRTRTPWVPDEWDNGHVMNKGRFLVYRPDCPRAYANGYALRAHVVWWLETGEAHPKGMNLHHKNGDKLDDRFENLELLEHGQHTAHHCKKKGVQFTCETCGVTFFVSVWRVRQRKKEGHVNRFCSQKCYHAFRCSYNYKQKIAGGQRKTWAEWKQQWRQQ